MNDKAEMWKDYLDRKYPFLADKKGALIDAFDKYIEDEAAAGPDYVGFAKVVREAGFPDIAEDIISIAKDEDRHLALLRQFKDTVMGRA